ncbi:MAG: hypothetical protein DMF64_05205 [Acidobacteria bacterium]|nr:MAG: hypothetical protein DMF64_05205 [Acidobacteriota bacterium]
MKTKARARSTAAPTRRQFAKAVAAAFVAAPLVVSLTNAQTPPATSATPTPTPQPSPTPQQPSPLAEAYAEVAHRRFGDKLSADELTRLKRNLEGSVRTGDALRAVKLQNSDEPDFVFSA